MLASSCYQKLWVMAVPVEVGEIFAGWLIDHVHRLVIVLPSMLSLFLIWSCDLIFNIRLQHLLHFFPVDQREWDHLELAPVWWVTALIVSICYLCTQKQKHCCVLVTKIVKKEDVTSTLTLYFQCDLLFVDGIYLLQTGLIDISNIYTKFTLADNIKWSSHILIVDLMLFLFGH